MSHQKHNATFEAGPSGHINGEKVQLVYTRSVDPPREIDYTFQALKASIEAEGRYFGRPKDDGEDPLDDRILARAAKFLTFLHSEDRS